MEKERKYIKGNNHKEKNKENSNNFLLEENKICDKFFKKNKILSLFDYNKCLCEKIEYDEMCVDIVDKIQSCVIFEGGRFEEKVLCGLYKINNVNTKRGPDGIKCINGEDCLYEIKSERESSYHKLRGRSTWNLERMDNVEDKFSEADWNLIQGGFTKNRRLIYSFYLKINKNFINVLIKKEKNYIRSNAVKVDFYDYTDYCDVYLKYISNDYKDYCTKPLVEYLEYLKNN